MGPGPSGPIKELIAESLRDSRSVNEGSVYVVELDRFNLILNEKEEVQNFLSLL